MSVFDDEPAPPSRRGPLLLVLALGAAICAAGAWFVLSLRQPPPPAETATRSAPARPRPAPPREPVRPRDTPAAGDRPTATRPSTESSPAPATATRGVLRVRSDVPGASVFLDRKFLGTTPLDLDGLEAGSHRLNVSVEGYDGHAQAVEIGEAPADVDVRFKDVRLNASVAVIHKHGMGSCTGRLVADTSGLRYETANAGDAFTMPFADLEGFTVDYLKKSLRVKRRGGKTWNFEDPNGQPDPLFVFHRDVDKARARLTAR
ncbi:MAG: PEGA domain-containing protein [Vicinamibacteraceae bacterium]